MTIKEFDNYRFSVNTMVNFQDDHWDKITEVDFYERWVGVERGQIVRCNEIKRIKQKPDTEQVLADDTVYCSCGQEAMKNSKWCSDCI